MKRASNIFNEVIKSCNVFTSPVNLRYDLDPDYNTFAGGCASIGLIVLLMSVFFNAWLQLLNKNAISSSTQTVRQFDPEYMTVNTDDFMFAIGVNNFNISDFSQKKYFDFKMAKYDVINGTKIKTTFPLEVCTAHHWEQLGDDFVETYSRSELSKFVCPPRNMTIQIVGKYTSERFVYYKLSMQKCTGSNCRNQSQIDAYIAANTAFFWDFYYANTLINPDQQQPLSSFFQDKDYVMFSSTMGTSANLYLGKYVMTTDESIFPWTDEQEKTGFIINRGQKQAWNYIITPAQSLSKLYIRKSNIRLQIDRKFRKVDDMLSYIGGLFGIIAVAFGFIMNYYGQCCFQLEMCQKIFDYDDKQNNKGKQGQNNSNLENSDLNHIKNDKDGWIIKQEKPVQPVQIIRPKDFGFLDFFLHIIYLGLKKVFNIKWHRMQVYDESVQEMRYKLDVGQLLQKLSFYDRSLNTLFDQNQLKLLYLQEKYNFSQIRDERTMLGMRKDIIANLFGMVAQNLPIKQLDPMNEQKKTLKQIAGQKSRKRLQTFMGKTFNVLDIFAKAGLKSAQVSDDINIPPEIKKALQKLQQKIQEGDLVSVRIYNGLQYDLLQAFEKIKSKKNKNNTSRKRMKKQNNVQQQSKGIKIGQIMFSNISPNKQGGRSPTDSARSIENFMEY